MSPSPELVTTASFTADRRKLVSVKACAERDEETLQELVRAYMRSRGKKGAGTSLATLKTYGNGLRRWVAFCWPDPEAAPSVSLLRARRDDVEEFIARLAEEGLRESTLQLYLSAVRAFYAALIWSEAIERSPAEHVRSPYDPKPRHERNEAVVLTDYKTLLESCKGKGSVGVRNAAMLRLMGDCGLRVAEAVALNVSDIRLKQEELVVRLGKGKKQRTQALTKSAVTALTIWLRRRKPLALDGEEGVLINVGLYCRKDLRGKRMSTDGVRGVLERLYLESGLPPSVSGAHVLRHTAGTRVYERTRDIYAVADYLGQNQIDTAARYVHSPNRRREIARLLDEDDTGS